jgi:xanthine dehydrogenase YagT iron-sulfur-binding subunit
VAADSNDSKVTRREFVSIVGAVTGGIALRIPGAVVPANAAVTSTPELQEARATNVVPVEMIINGRLQKWSLDPRVTLLDLLRDNAGLTGTKKGCDHGQCGACTVLVNGIRINSCLSLAVTHDQDHITTIEGIAANGINNGADNNDGNLHSLQAAFLEHDGLQCGYCTPGQICSATALLTEAQRGDASSVTQDLSKSGPADLTAAEIRERMSGNICRCGAYPGILQAVQSEYQKTNRGSKS